jgi:phosphatidylglycerophosphatase A
MNIYFIRIDKKKPWIFKLVQTRAKNIYCIRIDDKNVDI